MTSGSPVRVIRVLAIVVLVLATPSRAQNKPAISEEIAKAYGLDSFGQIEQIRYTFNIDSPALKLKVARSWVWEPKTGRISYDGKDKAGKPVKVNYLRSQLSSQDAVVKDEVDPAFNNDQYWVFFPFHQFQDSGTKVEDCGHAKTAAREGFRREGCGELFCGGGWLQTRRHLDTLRRSRQTR